MIPQSLLHSASLGLTAINVAVLQSVDSCALGQSAAVSYRVVEILNVAPLFAHTYAEETPLF